jgi:hypothetical protein
MGAFDLPLLLFCALCVSVCSVQIFWDGALRLRNREANPHNPRRCRRALLPHDARFCKPRLNEMKRTSRRDRSTPFSRGLKSRASRSPATVRCPRAPPAALASDGPFAAAVRGNLCSVGAELLRRRLVRGYERSVAGRRPLPVVAVLGHAAPGAVGDQVQRGPLRFFRGPGHRAGRKAASGHSFLAGHLARGCDESCVASSELVRVRVGTRGGGWPIRKGMDVRDERPGVASRDRRRTASGNSARPGVAAPVASQP